jgi:hypothetical protein
MTKIQSASSDQFLNLQNGHVAPLSIIYQSRMSVLGSKYAPMVSESCNQNLQSPVCVQLFPAVSSCLQLSPAVSSCLQLWSTSSTSPKTELWSLLLSRKLFSTHSNRGFNFFEFRIWFESISILKNSNIAPSVTRNWPFFYHQTFFDQITAQQNLFCLSRQVLTVLSQQIELFLWNPLI